MVFIILILNLRIETLLRLKAEFQRKLRHFMISSRWPFERKANTRAGSANGRLWTADRNLGSKTTASWAASADFTETGGDGIGSRFLQHK